MVRDNVPIIKAFISPPSPSLPDHEAADYTSLKRALSRTAAPIPIQFPHSAVQDHENNHHKSPSPAGSLRLDMSSPPMAAETALAALQYLPTPLLVLSSLKTIVLANDAMGRLLGLSNSNGKEKDGRLSVSEILHGQTLSQIGIDMVSDGVPVWVSWEKFFENLAPSTNEDPDTPSALEDHKSGESTPTAAADAYIPSWTGVEQPSTRNRTLVEDTVVDVIVSSQSLRSSKHGHHGHYHHHKSRMGSGVQATCRMIISIWVMDDERYFTLTFTSAYGQSSRSSKSSTASGSVPRAKSTTSSTHSTKSSQPHTPSSSRSSSAVTSPLEQTHQVAAFPSLSTAPNCATPTNVTDFQKVTRMKDAMLNAMEFPVLAMWRDESVVFPNQAARRLLAVTADPTSEESYDFMSRFRAYTADFEQELAEDENPIIKLCRTQQGFSRWQIGLINERTGKRSCYDVSGHPVKDEKTGEFFAGLIVFKDVTEYTEKIASQTAENEQQFQLICDTMPQMLWTTRPDGYHDYFSQRWYDYTGLSVNECIGLGWKLPFHEDDLPESGRRWMHSLATGEEYLTEYRCRRYDGEWRWMLGRALPLRDSKSSKIVKWFGTCTDIQDIVDARIASQHARQQLVDALRHAQMTMWIVDHNMTLTFFEGDIPDQTPETQNRDFVGQPAFSTIELHSNREAFKAAVRRIFDGESLLEVIELKERDRHFRCRMVPQRGEKGAGGHLDSQTIVGVAGISMDVTHVKKKEQENLKLLANETAAKEASKMKSNFLANMSHEIRTPIAGVLGMSELLMDTDLDPEQSDFAQNIQRSANSLLTVINDILDFSKIESGRLDIEEVQFSLSIVLGDVAKMLSYAAQRKNLEFSSDLQLGASGDLALLGDPGRIRQILTNLLTNSIKFTSDGYVKLTVRIISDTSDSTLIEFEVEDTGIGIEEEVKKRLFRPFSQADSSTARRFGGTGLGLTISKNLVDLMHGEINLESKLDCGTKATFRIPFKKLEFAPGTSTSLVELGALPDRLHSDLSFSGNNSSLDGKARRNSPPLQSPSKQASIKAHRATSKLPTESTSVPPLQRDKYHILVVEDNPVNQQIATRFIKSLKFSVGAVWNGKEALEYLLKATHPNRTKEEAQKYPIPSLILMDCQMPVLDGYHTTHVLRHHAPYTKIAAIRKTPIVAMTASAIQGDREKCEKAGMDDYLAKPVKRPILEQMILKWITGDIKTRPELQQRHDSTNSVESNYMPKPALSRTETDHSSNCAEIDNLAAEILGSRAPNQPPIPVKAIPQRPGLASMPSAQQKRRSSLSRTILASEIPGGESEAERSERRVQAEEKASSLRDAKLLAATQPGMGVARHLHSGMNTESHSKVAHLAGSAIDVMGSPDDLFHSNNASPLPRADIDREDSGTAGSMAPLTQENVEKLNRDHGGPSPSMGLRANGKVMDSYFGDQNLFKNTSTTHLAHEANSDADVDSNSDRDKEDGPFTSDLPIPDIPGPPPDEASSIREFDMPPEVVDLLRLKTQVAKVKRPTVLAANGRTKTLDSMSSNRNATSSDWAMLQSDWSKSSSTVHPDKK